MTAYYNEIDPYAALWLRNLISAGHIAPGDVDERSIVDVQADDLRGYTQCHFFAGIGGWSLALRLAGWPDDRPVWTGSCPCQPFSAAGASKAADDERHLWPAWFPLIRERRPATVFGEQVEAAVGWGWLDAVFSDLEGEGYACGAAVLPACGVGAPHIRQRLWFVADAGRGELQQQRVLGEFSSSSGATEGEAQQRQRDGLHAGRGGTTRLMADTMHTGRPQGRPSAGDRPATGGSGLGGMVNAASEQVGLPRRARQSREADRDLGDTAGCGRPRLGDQPAHALARQAGSWTSAEFIPCTDGKARPVEPGTFPLAHGIPARVGRLRAYGNAIVPQVAAEFIAATDCPY